MWQAMLDRWGNRITSLVSALPRARDARMPARGLGRLPTAFAVECLDVAGERYEFEMNVLMRAAVHGVWC